MIAFLTALLHRVEDTLIGDINKVMKPLTRIQTQLTAIQQAADKAATDARLDAAALLARADAHSEKAAAAVVAGAKLAALLG
jgi:hypothetical protein